MKNITYKVRTASRTVMWFNVFYNVHADAKYRIRKGIDDSHILLMVRNAIRNYVWRNIR